MENTHSLPKVSIVTLTFHHNEVTLELLSSLRNISYKNIEIIVVDNAPDAESHLIKEKFPEVIYLPQSQNLGFSGGNNAGIKVGTGDYFLLLNNDTEVDPNFLEPLLDVFKTYSKVGIVSSKLIYFNTPGLIQYAGAAEMNKYTGRSYAFGNKEQDTGQFDFVKKTAFAHGAAMLISKEIIDKIGLMAEEYFLYYEELDYAERVKRAGYDIYYCGFSKVYHKESISVGKTNSFKTYLIIRNRLLFIKKFTSGFDKLICLIFFYSISIPKNMLNFLLKGKRDLAMAVFLAAIGSKKHKLGGN